MNLGGYKIRKQTPKGPDPAEEALRVGAEVIAQARAWRADATLRQQTLQAATLEAHRATAQAASNSLAQDQQRQLLEQGWDHALAVLEQIQAAKVEIVEAAAAAAQLQEQHAAHFPGAAPGAFPGAVAAVPNVYPGGKSELGFLYGLITTLDAATLPLAGGTLSGDLRVPHLGVGKAPAYLIDAQSSNSKIRSFFTEDYSLGNGQYGWYIDKLDKTDGPAHGITWRVGGAATWQMGQDVSTNNSDNGGTGGSDFIPVFDFTSGWNDAGVRTSQGADILRFTPAEKSPTGKSTMFMLSGQAADRNSSTMFGQFKAGKDLGGLETSINADVAYPHLLFTQRSASHKRAIINYNQQWLQGCDLGATNAPDFYFYDSANALTRLFIQSTANTRAKVGINQISPLANLHVATGVAAGDYNTVQTAFAAGYSTLANRSMSLEQILDASAVVNYFWMHGHLDPASTRAVPTAHSTGGISSGLECTDAGLALVAAPTGANQTLSRPVQIAASALGFYGTAPIAQPGNTTDLKAVLTSLGLLASGGATPLNLGGGALTAGAANFSGQLSGSGGGLSVSSSNPTPATDADHTLTAPQYQAFWVVLSAGAWTAPHNVIFPNTANGLWLFENLSGQTATAKTAAGAGIAVATNKRALLIGNGTSIFRVSADI